MDLFAQLERNLRPGPDYEDERDDIGLPTPPPVRMIAYYLPQFHPIPENDEWWGKGFTEWTNVTKALPRFAGHFQPQLPGGLGFYDLRLTETLRQQASLARRHGISGFCFHYYWFSGRRLLEKPLELLLSDPDIDMPFCVNWANESWTRTWDSSEQHVLMAQRYSAEYDIAFAAALEPAMRDHRYIRINGRPLLMIYRPGLLPDATATVTRWRQYFISRGVGDPFMVMPQAFGNDDPRVFGMDAAAGFPPHKFGWDLPPITASLPLLDRRFRGSVVSYESMARAAMAARSEDYRLFPGVCPSWDNEARRPARGLTFSGSSPRLYGTWLEHAGRMALQAPDYDERIVFINAWNEWAEGAHLEPDLHHGYAYLRETARVLNRLVQPHATGLLAAAPSRLVTGHAGRHPARRIVRIIHKARRKAADAADHLASALRPS